MRGKLSDWQITKLSALFELLDSDGDGRLEENELKAVLERLRVETGWPAGSRVTRHVEARWQTLLTRLFTGRSTLTCAHWLDTFAQTLSKERELRIASESYRGPVEEFAQLLFLLLDQDRNGEIAPEEFLLFIYAIGRHDRDGQQSFLQLDVDGRGTLRKGNVEDLALEYFHSAEQGSAGDWLFGPPPEA